MKRGGARTWLTALGVLAGLSAIGGALDACGGLPDESFGARVLAEGGPEAAEASSPLDAFTVDMTRAYLRELAPYLVSRELEEPELLTIEQQKFHAIAPILQAWTKEPGFARAARRMVSQRLSVSGARDGIDFDLPGNLAEQIARDDLPISTLLTADYCVDKTGARGECDTGAPYKAGVLATRAYMVSRASRFNLTRAGTMMLAFACETYPMTAQLEPRIPNTRLIKLFQSDTEVDENGKPKSTFGNGVACYNCHGQFGPHAQLFVRFDDTGKYRPEATGLQDPEGQLGRATAGLFTSHMLDPLEAKEEKSQMLGRPVANLAEAGRVLAESPTFVSCQVENLLDYAIRIPPAASIDREVRDEISATAGGKLATFASLVTSTFSHPRVVSSVVAALGGTP